MQWHRLLNLRKHRKNNLKTIEVGHAPFVKEMDTLPRNALRIQHQVRNQIDCIELGGVIIVQEITVCARFMVVKQEITNVLDVGDITMNGYV